MNDLIVFQAPTDKGAARLYGNRVEIDRRGAFGTTTDTVFLWNVAKMRYSGGRGLDLIAPNGTSTGLTLRSKEDAKAIHGLLSRMVGATGHDSRANRQGGRHMC